MTGTIASDEGCASMLAESGIIHDLIELLKGKYINNKKPLIKRVCQTVQGFLQIKS